MQVPQICRGRGVAKRCEAEGSVKVEFKDYILDLWQKIEYTPANFDISEIDDNESSEQEWEFSLLQKCGY